MKCDVHWCNALSTQNSRWCAVHQDEYEQQGPDLQRAEGPYPLDISFEVLQKTAAITGGGSGLYDAAKRFGENMDSRMQGIAQGGQNRFQGSAIDPATSQQQLTLPGDLARTVGGGLAGAALGGPVGALAGGAAGMGLLGAGKQAGDSSRVNVNIPKVPIAAGPSLGTDADKFLSGSGTGTVRGDMRALLGTMKPGAKRAAKGAAAGVNMGAPFGPGGIVAGGLAGGAAGAMGYTPGAFTDKLKEGARAGLTGVKTAGGAALGALGAAGKKLGRGIAGGLGVPDWWSPDKTGGHGDKYKYSANAPRFVQNAQKEILQQKLQGQGRFKGGAAATPDEQKEQLREFL